MKQKGYLLIEIMMASAVIVLVLTALVSATITSLRNTSFAKQKVVATAYTKEALEFVRSKRDQAEDWEAFAAFYNGNKLFGKDDEEISLEDCPLTSPQPNIDNFYMRCVNFEDIANGKKVTATVSWASGICSAGSFCHQVQSITYFTKWQE